MDLIRPRFFDELITLDNYKISVNRKTVRFIAHAGSLRFPEVHCGWRNSENAFAF